MTTILQLYWTDHAWARFYTKVRPEMHSRATVALLLTYNLRVPFALLHPHQKLHPGDSLRLR